MAFSKIKSTLQPKVTAFSKPGSLLQASRNPKMKAAVMKHLKHKGFKVKDTGSFHGKSNALGHGGRAAQLKAQGVPGGVIGALARKAQAAPGQKNYHGKKSMKRKASKGNVQGMEMGMKKAVKRKESESVDMMPKKSAAHYHIHVHGKHAGAIHIHTKGGKFGDEKEQGTNLEHEEEDAKHFKKSDKKEKHSEKAIKGLEEFAKEEGKEKSAHKCKSAACKASHKEKRSKKA